MSDDGWKSIAVIGVIGLGAWYLIGKTQEAVVNRGFDEFRQYWESLFGHSDTGGDKIIRDGHGCVVGVSDWCSYLGGCVPKGMTCPDPWVNPVIEPTTDPTQCSDGWSWCEKQGHCVADYLISPSYCDSGYIPPWEQPPENPGYIPGLADFCTWPNGDPLTVPAGMDCGEAVESMCNRFSSIPGYKGCSS